jgi:hypothetical protein
MPAMLTFSPPESRNRAQERSPDREERLLTTHRHIAAVEFTGLIGWSGFSGQWNYNLGEMKRISKVVSMGARGKGQGASR